jgi:hypothetical protein
MVFGMPMTLSASPCRPASSAIFRAPRSVPSPPMAKDADLQAHKRLDHLRRVLRPARGYTVPPIS